MRRRARQGDLRDRQGDERDEMETQGGKEESTWQERARMRKEEGNGDRERGRRGGWEALVREEEGKMERQVEERDGV